MLIRKASCTLALAAVLLSYQPAMAETTLRIAMTASDIPTATGMPNNGFEGMRFLGYPIFEGLVLWDLTRTDQLAALRPGLAEKWEQDPGRQQDLDLPSAPRREIPRRHRFQCRCGDLESRALLQQRQPAIRAAGLRHLARARAGDGRPTRRSTTTPSRSPPSSRRPTSPIWRSICCSPRRPRSRRPERTGPRSRRCRPPAPGRSGSPRWCRARWSSLRAMTATGTRHQQGQGRQGPADADSRGQLAAGGACAPARSTGSRCRRPMASPR